MAARDHYFQPWSLIEVRLYTGGIVLAVDRRVGWALVLTAVAALNREAGLFVPLLFCAALPGRWLDGKRIVWLLVLGATSLAILCGLCLMIGLRPHPTDIASRLHTNLQPKLIARSLLAMAALFSLCLPAALGWFRAPAEIRRCTAILPLYAVTVLLYSQWWEVRLWLPVACIVLPLALGGVQSLVSGSGPRLGGKDRPGQ